MQSELIMIDQNNLPMGEITLVSWVAPEDMTQDQWEEVGRRFKSFRESSAWWIGDWLNEGARRCEEALGEGIWKGYGDLYARAVELTGHTYNTLRNLKSVAGQVTGDIRVPELSWSHHKAVRSLAEDDQREMLQYALKEKLTYLDLEEFVRAHEQESIASSLRPALPLPDRPDEETKRQHQESVERDRLYQQQRAVTPAGQSQAAKAKVEQNLEVVKNAISRAHAALCSARYIMRYVPETPVLLGQHMESTRQMILEFYPDSEVLSEVNPIWLENIGLREQAAEQAAQIASLQRALDSKTKVNGAIRDALALSSVEIELGN